jgi:hypothetical protein
MGMSKSYYHPFLHCFINVIFVGNSDQENKKVIQTFQNLKGLQMFARKYGLMSKFEKKLIWGDFFRIF